MELIDYKQVTSYEVTPVDELDMKLKINFIEGKSIELLFDYSDVLSLRDFINNRIGEYNKKNPKNKI